MDTERLPDLLIYIKSNSFIRLPSAQATSIVTKLSYMVKIENAMPNQSILPKLKQHADSIF